MDAEYVVEYWFMINLLQPHCQYSNRLSDNLCVWNELVNKYFCSLIEMDIRSVVYRVFSQDW